MLLKDYCLCEKELIISAGNDKDKICPDKKCKYNKMVIVNNNTIVDFYVGKTRVHINYQEKIAQIDWFHSTDFDCLLDITTIEEMKEKLNFILTFS